MPPLARPLHLALLVALVLIGALCADAASDACAEALADPATAYSYWAASGKTINDPGNFEDCRVMFPNSTFCLLSVFLNDSAPGGGILNAGVINPVGLSLCLPSACADNFEEGFDALLPYLSKYGVVASLSGTTCGQWDTMPKLPTGARVMVGVIVTLAVLVVLGSLLGFVERRLSLREPYIVSHDAEHDTLRTPGDETPLLGHHVKKDQPHQFKGQVFAFFRCFSVFHNCPRLIATDGSHLAYLNGVRVFSMFWVITGHTILWNLGLMSNFNEIPAIVGEFGMQLLWNAPFSVDSFFFLSGLLVAYLSFGAMKKGVFSWGLYYLHRYVRLTPVYLFWIMVLWKLVPYIATGPFYAIRISASTGDCSDGWWRDILYINNFFSMNSICYPVAWYLGNDMQFYVIAPFLIYLFYRSRRYGMAALAVCVVGTIAANWGVSYGYHILGTSQNPKIQNDYQNMLYSKPWMRAGPYLIGMATGLALAVLPRHQRYSTLVRYPMYIAAAGVALTLLFSTWDNYKTDTSAFWGVPSWAAYNALSRTAWAMCLAAFVIPFASGYGDFVRKFLGAALWTPLARLTFGAYLIHPVVLSYYVAVRTDPWRYTFRSWMEISVFVILIAYGLSFVSYLCLEKPLMNVEAWVTRLLRGAPAAHGEDRHRSVNEARE